jgi:hypothetical protein
VVVFSVINLKLKTDLFTRSIIMGMIGAFLIEIPTYFMFKDRCRLFMAQKKSASSEMSLRRLLNVIPEGFAIFTK